MDAMCDTISEGYLGYIKSQAHQKPGKSQFFVRIEIRDGEAPIPRKDWQSFFKDKQNAQELYDFISDKIITCPDLSHLDVISDKGEGVLCNNNLNETSFLEPNNHYEADTKVFLHLMDAVNKGHTKEFI